MKKSFVKKLTVMSVFVVFLAITGCSFATGTSSSAVVNDISDTLNYRTIKSRFYMGGSVLYNPNDLSNSHISDGVSIAVRLGKVNRTEEMYEEIFTDQQDEATFGYITVTHVSKKSISFDYTEYSSEGNFIKTSSFSLEENQKADLNGDGVSDIKYEKPIRKRAGLEKSMWLTFLSSQEELLTSMYSIIPEQYARSVYPSGLFGINPEGKFIASKYELNSNTRAVVKGLATGDYVLDSKTGKYLKVKNNTFYRNARNIDDADLEESNFEEINFLFTEEDFSSECPAKDLLNALPLKLTQDYLTLTETRQLVGVLNELLANPKLITYCAEDKSLVLEDEVTEIIAITDTLTEYELTSFNRLFLSEIYKEVCPAVDYNCVDITEIMPLAYVHISEDIPQTEEDTIIEEESFDPNRFASYNRGADFNTVTKIGKWGNIPVKGEAGYAFAKSYSDYIDEVEKINDIVYGHKEIKLGIFSKNITNNTFGLGNSDVGNLSFFEVDISPSLYIGGDFSISWSKCNAELATHLMLSVYAKTCLKYKFEKSLIGGREQLFKKDGFVALFGILPIAWGIYGDYDVLFSVEDSIKACDYLYAGFTGLAGAKAEIGASYGSRWVKWFRVWRKWVYRPSVYFEPYLSGKGVARCASFAGIAKSDDNNYGHTITAKISPYFELVPYIGLGVPAGNISVNTPIRETVNMGIVFYPDKRINGFIKDDFKIHLGGSFDLDLPVIGHKSMYFAKTKVFDTSFIDLTFPIKQ